MPGKVGVCRCYLRLPGVMLSVEPIHPMLVQELPVYVIHVNHVTATKSGETDITNRALGLYAWMLGVVPHGASLFADTRCFAPRAMM